MFNRQGSYFMGNSLVSGAKALPAVQMFAGQDGARHIELGARLVAPHVALVVPGSKLKISRTGSCFLLYR